MKRISAVALVCVLVLSLGTMCAAKDHSPADVTARHGMVAAANELASQAGTEILKEGGNAVDAAVATAFALNVVESNASGIGGGGFMLIRMAGSDKVVAIDYREKAPAASTPDMFASEEAKKNNISEFSPFAVGVPGTVAGMVMALDKYGTMSLAQVMAPAIRLAEEGFPLARVTSESAKDHFDTLTKFNDPSKFVFFTNGLPAEPGTIIKQPNLAKAFRLIAKDGRKAFYEGPIGEAMIKRLQELGGKMTMEDLKNYEAVIREPAEGTYRGYKIFSMSPPSSGGVTLVEILNIMENFPVSEWGYNSPRTIHYMTEAYKMAFADRSKFLGDPDFLTIPLKGLTSKEYAKVLAGKIHPFEAMKQVSTGDPSMYEHFSTTHASVADAKGNLVAFTQTVNDFFGSSIIEPEYGFVLNNEMDDFSSNPESVNAPGPGKRPLSSMSPSIVLDPEERPFLVAGTPGAWRIITSMAEIITNLVDFHMSMDEAIEAPRFTCRSIGGKPDALQVESRIPEQTLVLLKLRGHDIKVRGDYDLYFGGAQGILFDPVKDILIGGADSRRDGVAVGY